MSSGTHNIMETASVASDSTVSPVSILWAGQYRVWFLVGAMEFYLLQNIHSTTVPTQATTELVSRDSFSTGRATQVVKLTAHLDLVLRLRNSGAIPLLPIQTSTVCQGRVYLY